MRKFKTILAAACLGALLFSGCGEGARDQIRMVGSSTVYPFAASVAEHLGHAGMFRTPVVESTGTGAGFKLFCAGTDLRSPDITNASRPMLPSERGYCAKNGVKDPVAVTFGYDGITLANAASARHFMLTRKQIFLALARDLPGADGRLARNSYTRWRQIDANLPDLPIKVYGTPPVSGTRDTFVELVMQKGCDMLPDVPRLVSDKDARKRLCTTIREDGAFIEAGENGNLIAQKLIGDPEALGIFGFSFLDQNSGILQGSDIDGVAPRFETIQSGQYPVARPLLFYVKREHLASVPGIKAYTELFLNDTAIGEDGYLAREGLVPLPAAIRAKMRAQVALALR